MFTLSYRSVLLLVVYQLGFSFHYVNSQPNETSWERYVRAPSSRLVKPKAILSEYTLGGVVNPDGLISGEDPPTLLYRDENSASTPTLVVDFGQNVVGLPVLELAGSGNASAGGFPGLRLYFSESLEFLGDRSDFTRSDNAEEVRELHTSSTGGVQATYSRAQKVNWKIGSSEDCAFRNGPGEFALYTYII